MSKPKKAKASKRHTEAEYQELKKATTALAKCAITTLMSDGKLGVGSGMMFDRETKALRHWSVQFFDALDMVGVSYDREKFFAKKKRA